MNSKHYDGIVIGAGQAGGPLAGALAKAGWSIALIEKEHVGGTCVNEGCTPTKTMVASARVAHLARRAEDYGVKTGPVSVDLNKVRQRKRDIVEMFRSSSQNSLEKISNLDLIMAQAQFSGPKTLELTLPNNNKRQISGDKIFVNVGARASMPPIPGLAEINALTARTMMELDEVPEKFLILGGGYIGLEFGQMFRRFGSEVTIVEMAPRFLPREDEEVAEELAKILYEDGIRLLINTKAVAVRQQGGCIELDVANAAGTETLTGSQLLVAAGRRPNSDSLNLAAAGIITDARGFIVVDEKLATTASDVYALGDVKGGPAFTHISYDDYRIVRDNLLKDAKRSTKGRIVPYTVFTDPQLGRVGLSEAEARAQGLNIKVAKLPMTRVARALETAETRGFMKAVLDADTGQILGATILGIEGGEIMSVLQMAMMGKVSYGTIRDSAFAHPTLAESLNNLFMTLDK